jgi:BlaI family transcriptional regulator, penicillinase repressor
LGCGAGASSNAGIDTIRRFVRFPKSNLENQIEPDTGAPAMGRPPAKDLTERELEVMHVFWQRGETTAAEARDVLAASGLDRTYTTIANLVRTLYDKGFLKQVNETRPFVYRPARSYKDVSGRLLVDLLERVFLGSRADLLYRLVEERKLTAKERAILENLAKERGR